VENPREIVSPGDDVKVKILEIDSERRRLSLSVKRVEDQILPSATRAAEGGVPMDAGDLDDLPELGLSDDVFAEGATPPEAGVDVEEPPAEVEEPPAEVEAEAEAEVSADVEADSLGEADVPAEDEEPSA
jgi:small subunit ribosomal protein S1